MSPWLARLIDYGVGAGVRTIVGRVKARTRPADLERYLGRWEGRPVDELLPGPEMPADVRVGPPSVSLGRRRRTVTFRSHLPFGCTHNDVVHGTLVTHADAPEDANRPVVIVVPGWLTRGTRDYELWVSRHVVPDGADTLILEMPHHGRRCPPDVYSGIRAISGDLIRTAEMLRQAVADVGAAMAWLRSLGRPRVGVWGESLGGWIAALFAERVAECDMLMAVAAAVKIPELFHSAPMTPTIIRDVRNSGIPKPLLARALDLLSPLRFPLRLPHERVTLVQTELDGMIVPENTDHLWSHWGRPPRVLVPEGHISVRLSPIYVSALQNAVRATLLDGRRMPALPAPAAGAEPMRALPAPIMPA